VWVQSAILYFVILGKFKISMKKVLSTQWKYGRLLVAATLLAIAALGFATRTASAHTLDLDGDIAVVLHVNPNDMPVSSSPTSFILFFNDSTNRFALSKCNCKATILEDTQTIVTEQLVASSPLQSNDPITFPKPDVYTIEVSGKPKDGHAFQPFFVSYTVRVIPGVKKPKLVPNLVWAGLGVVVVSVFAYVIILTIRERRQR
jgi:hypothetical protein